MSTHNWEAIEKDKEMKTQLVVDTITSFCTSTSPHEILREIATELQAGDHLVAKILTGGLTNFSYKVCLSNSPDKALFTKLCFPYAFWNPDPDFFYDVKRTANEFEMMQRFSNIANDCVAKPLLCKSIDDMMILVTEWCSSGDEQWANQFIDGRVDTRIAPKLAASIAKLHCVRDFHPDFNTNVRPCTVSLFGQIIDCLCSLIDSPDTDDSHRTQEIAREIGKEECGVLVERMLDNFENDRDCLIHNDLHPFNLLVEAKPDKESTMSFGPNGAVAICDWEMSIAGPIGRDIGIFMVFPTACVLAHALNGDTDASLHILDFVDIMWEEYAAAMADGGSKTKEELCEIYRNILGWCGAFLFCVQFMMRLHLDWLPLDSSDEAVCKQYRDAAGVVGINLFRMGFEDSDAEHSSLEQIRGSYRKVVDYELEAIRLTKVPSRQRRPSALRASGCRVSDAALGCSSLGVSTIVHEEH